MPCRRHKRRTRGRFARAGPRLDSRRPSEGRLFRDCSLCNTKFPTRRIAMTSAAAPRVLPPEARNSHWWRDHFVRNRSRQLAIPWPAAAPLSDEQRRRLLPSLQDFQLGESSEGRHGQARAAVYAARVGDPHYAEAVRLFFAEENRHATYLARFLACHGVEPIGRSWTDFIFRRVRRLMGLELLLTVLLTAELIGEVYYRAVRTATRCPA